MRGAARPQGRDTWRRLTLFGLLDAALPLGFNFEALRHLSAGIFPIGRPVASDA